MNNSVFVKIMEDLRQQVNVKLVRATDEDKILKIIASLLFARANISDDDLPRLKYTRAVLCLSSQSMLE